MRACARGAALLAGAALQTALAAGPACQPFPITDGLGSPAAVTTPDGSVWYALSSRLVRVQDRKPTPVLPVDPATQRLSGLALGPDGALWYSKDTSARIGRLPLDGSAGREFAIPEARFVTGLKAGPQHLWFYDPVVHFVGRMSTDGEVRRYTVPALNGYPFAPSGLALAPDGAAWVAVLGHNALYRLDPQSGEAQRHDIPSPRAQPSAMVVAPDGEVWVAMPAVRKLGRVRAGGTVTEVEVGEAPRHLLWGADGALWYSASGSVIGRVGADGAVTRFRCGFDPGALTIGPDKRVWAVGNTQMLVVTEPGASSRAAVVAEGGGLPKPGAVREVSPQALEQVLREAGAGRTVLQLTSDDPDCGFCTRSNTAYEQLAAAHGGRAQFLRVRFHPWGRKGYDPAARGLDLGGLPVLLVVEGGREQARVMGYKTAAEWEAAILAPTSPASAPGR